MKELLKFYADWCGPCRMMKGTIQRVASAHNLPVVEINVDEHPDVMDEYNVEAIPTLILLEDGVEVARFRGANTQARVEEGLKLR